MKNCTLCQERIADKLNSHIIPKFMCKRLFENSNPRHSIQLSKDGKQFKLQDVPKENNIFCKQCENRFEKLETYFSRVLIEINSLQNAVRKYEIELTDNQDVLSCNDITPSLFHLFFYSLLWRASISKHILFDTFKIGTEVQEELRIFLNENLFDTQKDLLLNAKTITKIPIYHTCFIKPKNNTRGIFSAYNFAPNAYAIYTVDYALFFYTKEDDCMPAHKLYGNISNEIIKVVLANDENWKVLNNSVVKNMLNHQTPR
ncbi:hypothetical protein LNQ49_17000 [Flavobacterium sp. F-65]|uniref:Uncharacterized protein n=1 Tax=Flavobacterium pisciphilum TaxID=2893755 RepID=A0ABS8MX31_9FLAO|nr:hypothetical protein [Flavobacterium sp. F-65]MCC9073278.1 hypothetical protein [Flavobacterium sp. F-65]